MKTHNLLQMLKAAVLPKEYANAEPKRLRLAVFTGLGQIVRHAWRVILEVLEELWATLDPGSSRKGHGAQRTGLLKTDHNVLKVVVVHG